MEDKQSSSSVSFFPQANVVANDRSSATSFASLEEINGQGTHDDVF
jgi:hypothetical protein